MAAEHAQLVKILGMLGSSHEGEAASAARRATEYVRSRGLRWADLIASQPEKRKVERRLLALRDHARGAKNPFDKEEVAELKRVISEFTLADEPEPALLRRIGWLEAIAGHTPDADGEGTG